MKLAYVVHRYPPFPGGSEYYVAAMAEESARRGHQVTAFTGMCEKGRRNNVEVTTELDRLLHEKFDLIIVHGADVWVQDWVLSNAEKIQSHSPILYLIIKPSTSYISLKALEQVKFIGISTKADADHVEKYQPVGKTISVRHSIPNKFEDVLGTKGIFKEQMGIETKYMFLSAGGFWPHKGMDELSEVFESTNREDVTLVLLGYQNQEFVPKDRKNVRSFICNDRQDVLNALADADLYIMNSTEEGFGLVLLEAMANKTPWVSRRIAGAIELEEYGYTYQTKDSLYDILKRWQTENIQYLNVTFGADYVKKHRQIKNTVDDIEKCLSAPSQ